MLHTDLFDIRFSYESEEETSPTNDNSYFNELFGRCQILPEDSIDSDIDLLYERKQLAVIIEKYTPLNLYQSYSTLLHHAVIITPILLCIVHYCRCTTPTQSK